MEIREAILGDEKNLIDLFDILDAETNFMLMEEGERKVSIEYQAKLIEIFLKSNSEVLLVALEGEKFVGFLGGKGGEANRERHTLHIAMGVIMSHWRKRIGTELIRFVSSWAMNHSFHRIELSVLESNFRARSFYQDSGFVVEGVRRDSMKVNGQFFNELYMAKLI